MASLNVVAVTGRMTRDIEMRSTTTGKTVGSFAVAVDGRSKDDTSFFEVVAWGQQAEFLENYGGKGRMVAVSGRLVQRKYEKDGQTRSVVEIVAESINLLDRAQDDGGGNGGGQRASNPAPASGGRAPAAPDEYDPFADN